MAALRLLVFAFSICLFASCTSRQAGETSSTSEDSTAVPGVGVAPDSSNAVSDSTIERQQRDTASGRNP
jgi:hypothetical protein